jgi:hypothetical protein
LLTIRGQIFGGSDSDSFNDSLLTGFTSLHYLTEIIAIGDERDLETYQFEYSSGDGNQNLVISEVHGNAADVNKKPSTFYKAGKIRKVEGQLIREEKSLPNGTNVTVSIITGLRFTTTKDIENPAYNGPKGESFSEYFKGYTLGYVEGKSSKYIDELQFIWYQTTD